MQAILAIDTATGPCSVAILRGGQIIASFESAKPVMQSASLLPMIEQALAHSKLRYEDLNTIACTVGPGSFTGIRVGLATARAIAFASKIPCHGFSTLEVMAYAARLYTSESHILSALNAGKGECYYQHFTLSPTFQPIEQPALGILPAGNDTAVGNLSLTGPYTQLPVIAPTAEALALLANSGLLSPHAPSPIYIRPPDAKLPTSAF
jgi:tRNA threonylcarbamoyladenosine biosynthesis protein TsaB